MFHRMLPLFLAFLPICGFTASSDSTCLTERGDAARVCNQNHISTTTYQRCAQKLSPDCRQSLSGAAVVNAAPACLRAADQCSREAALAHRNCAFDSIASNRCRQEALPLKRATEKCQDKQYELCGSEVGHQAKETCKVKNDAAIKQACADLEKVIRAEIGIARKK